jgi:hypothetical protein
MKDWKPYYEMTPEEKFEHDVSRIINTSIDDAKYVIRSATREVLIEALHRARGQEVPRVSLIKILVSAIRKNPVEAGVGMFIRFYTNTTRPNTTNIGRITEVIRNPHGVAIGYNVENSVMKYASIPPEDIICVCHSAKDL